MNKLSKPIPFITLDDKDSLFSISPEAIQYLRTLTGDIAIVGIAGLYRTGKSYLLDLLLGRMDEGEMFGVGGTVNAYTKGIWIWGEPLEVKNTEVTVIFMDTEGLGSTQRTATQDTRIFALALLLSSYFMYNSRGVIDNNAIEDLSLVINLTKYVHVKAHEGETTGDIAQFFPAFMWVVRDFTLQLQDDGKKISSPEYLETALKLQPGFNDGITSKNHIRSLLTTFFPDRDCVTLVRPLNDESLLRDLTSQPYESLRPEFRKQVESLRTKIFSKLRPKQIMGNNLNGPMLVSLAEAYVGAFNCGSTPVISTAWDRVLSSQCEETYEKVLALFKERLEKATTVLRDGESSLPMEEEAMETIFQELETRALEELYQSGTVTVADILEPFRQRLVDSIMELRESYDKTNIDVSTQFCTKIISNLYEKMPAPSKREEPEKGEEDEEDEETRGDLVWVKTGLEEYKEAVHQMVQQYREASKGPEKENVLSRFLSERLLSGVIQWGGDVTVLFRKKNEAMQRKLIAAKQQTKAVEGRVNAATEIAAAQKQSFEKALEMSEKRITEERDALKEEAAVKQEEIDRAVAQLRSVSESNDEILKRLDQEIAEAREAVHRFEDTTEKERSQRRQDIKGVNRELLESERSFHREEKDLIKGQHDLIGRVVELERTLGEQKAQQMREIYELDDEKKEKIEIIRAEFNEQRNELKTKLKTDIRALRDTQDKEALALQSDLSDKRAEVSSLQDIINGKSQLPKRPQPNNGSSKSKSSKKSISDCSVH